MNQRFKFFISHSSQTRELALHIYLLAFSNGVFTWYDESLLKHGTNIKASLIEGIQNSEAFLLLHSKPAMESEWVAFEMQVAEEMAKQNLAYRRIVIKLDDEPLPESWQPYQYMEWKHDDLPGSMVSLISTITDKKPTINFAATALLSSATFSVFHNISGTIAEQSRNYVFYYLAHIKQILSALNKSVHTDELRDSLGKILQLSVFVEIPVVQGGIFPIEPGMFEIVHATRMMRPPAVSVIGLPKQYTYSIIENNEIFCRVAILDSTTKELVTHAVPVSFSFDARP